MVTLIIVKLGGIGVRPIDGDVLLLIFDEYEKIISETQQECTEKSPESAEQFAKIAQMQKNQLDYFRKVINVLPTIEIKSNEDNSLQYAKPTILN